MWLDWDSALSMLGHEPETKSSYEAYIDRFGLPHCFFDVGANYGLHSMLFLAHGVDVVSFEPNVGCHEYMERLEYLNDVQFCIESCAVGSHEGIAELCYPEWDTWLGTVDPGRSREISSEYSTRRVEVPCDTLDAYARRTGRVPELIKIDTEGSEYDVLLGASDTLRNKRPVVIFESWRDARRIKLWELLNGFDYAIVRLPLQHPVLGSSIEQSKFCDEPGNNFATVPSELL
jgi:FkbM family methyltransferase